MDERFTVANMTTEWGALVGWFPVDRRTREFTRSNDVEVAADPDATYLRRIRVDLSTVSPTVAGPDTVQAARSVREVAGTPIQKAYLVSCVNSRLEDLEAAAQVVAGRRVAESVEFYVAAASREVQAEAELSGAWATLIESGARVLSPGCGPCIGLGTGLLEAGEVGISATNRNFKGRMGSRDAQCYLASPAVVAASALAGSIQTGRPFVPTELATDCETCAAGEAASERVEILDGFPARVEGRLVVLTADNLNTDGIYGKDYTYRDDVTREEMARVVMENYDPALASRLRPGDLIVGGWNFGTGSSREQAITALQAAGIGLVAAASFSQTYLRNAFNNGFACIGCQELVARLRAELGTNERSILPGDTLAIDFAAGEATWRGESFRFPPLGTVPQELVLKGGVENLVKKRLEQHGG
jgi:homoaconitate hydratase